MKDLTTNKHGKESFICAEPQPTGIDAYFTCLRRLKPLFKNTDFSESTPSLYINYIGNTWIGNFGSVRLNYFTNNALKTKQSIDDFLKQYPDVKLLEGNDFRKYPPDNAKTAPDGGEEERWRNFCRAYSYIGLDLLYYNITCSRKLALDYRLNYFPQRLSARQLFEPIFKNYSSFFNSDYSAENLWEDLDSPWDHFFINMLLPGEPHEFFSFDYRSLTEEQKADIANRLNLNLSGNWRSDCFKI